MSDCLKFVEIEVTMDGDNIIIYEGLNQSEVSIPIHQAITIAKHIINIVEPLEKETENAT